MPGNNDNKLRVIIVGAGIAGLAVARALREHHDVIVLEQSALKTEVGAGIGVGPNASRIALQWGLNLERLNACDSKKFTECDSEGNIKIERTYDTHRTYGAPWLLCHRADLYNELRRLAITEALPGTPAEIRAATRVVSIDCVNGVLKLESGETVEGELIIGADGIHSKVREALFEGQDVPARPSGNSAYRALIPASKLKDDEKLSSWLEPGLRIFVKDDQRIIVYPCRGGNFLNFASVVPDHLLGKESLESCQWSAPGSVSNLMSSFSSFGEDSRRLLSHIDECSLWKLCDRSPLNCWSRGRVIIIGDAAHAMLPHQGQGAGQAIEDAEAVGAVLADLGKSDASLIPGRLKFVEQLRLERTSIIQANSRDAGPSAKDTSPKTIIQERRHYAFDYAGARDWAERHGLQWPVKPVVRVDKN